MKWCEVKVETRSETADLVSDVMFEAGMDGVEITDRNNLSFLASDSSRWDYIDEDFVNGYPEKVFVRGLFELENHEKKIADLKAALKETAELFTLDFGTLEISASEIEDDGWAENWKKYYTPFEIGEIAIVPKWENYNTDKIKVILDPGIAFGTGNHPTTGGCIELMQKLDLKDRKITDMGCGSGILGITALKLGASNCDFCDISEDAYRMTLENAAYNSIPQEKMRVILGDVLSDASAAENFKDGDYDVAFANLTAGILAAFSGFFGEKIKNGGYLIASGIISERKREVEKTYLASGFEIIGNYEKDGWVTYLFRNKGPVYSSDN